MRNKVAIKRRGVQRNFYTAVKLFFLCFLRAQVRETAFRRVEARGGAPLWPLLRVLWSESARTRRRAPFQIKEIVSFMEKE